MKKVCIILAVLLLLFTAVCFGYHFISLQKQAMEEEAAIQEISKIVFPTKSEVAEEIQQETETDKNSDIDTYDYAALQGINEECIGWIRIDDTKIDYPVMWRQNDNTFYLRHDIYGNYSYRGTPYLDASCNPDSHLIIYGHNVSDGHTFQPLLKYQEKDFWKDHQIITLYLEYDKCLFEVFAVCNISATYEEEFFHIPINYYSEKFQDYIQSVMEKSLYQTNIYVTDTDQILLLVTCEYSQENGRCVVFAHKISPDIERVN